MAQINVGIAANDHTGDPLRTAFQKINQSKPEWFNVKYYGAVGDGVADDSAAIQAAINAASAVPTGFAGPTGYGRGVEVFFPPGNYLCRSALTISTYLLLVGFSYEGSCLTFNLTVPGTCINWNNTTLAVRFGFGAKNMAFAGQSATDLQTLFTLTNCMGIVFERCEFGGLASGAGVQVAFGTLTQTSYAMWEHCFFSNCATCFDDSAATGSNENLVFTHVSFSQNVSLAVGAFGVVCRQASADYHFFACSFDSVRLVLQNGTVTTVGCHFEDPNNKMSTTSLVIDQSPGATWTSVGDYFLQQGATNGLIAWGFGTATIQGRWSAAGVSAASLPFVVLSGACSIFIDPTALPTPLGANVTAYFAGTSTKPCGMLPIPDTVGADRGDNSVTLVPFVDFQTQLFNTPLTAPRTATGNTALQAWGARFHIVRTAAATGASTLTTPSGKTLAAGQWATDVLQQNGTWREIASGSL